MSAFFERIRSGKSGSRAQPKKAFSRSSRTVNCFFTFRILAAKHVIHQPVAKGNNSRLGSILETTTL